MLTGVVIAESLRADAQLDGRFIGITRVMRVAVEDTADGQPPVWTVIEFEADEARAEALAGQLAAALDTTGAWYVDFHSADQSFVVFAEKVIRYRRGDADGRREAERYARSIGAPASQLDWRESLAHATGRGMGSPVRTSEIRLSAVLTKSDRFVPEGLDGERQSASVISFASTETHARRNAVPARPSDWKVLVVGCQREAVDDVDGGHTHPRSRYALTRSRRDPGAATDRLRGLRPSSTCRSGRGRTGGARSSRPCSRLPSAGRCPRSRPVPGRR